MSADPPELIERTLELSRKEGASEVEALLQQTLVTSVGCRNGTLEKVESAESSGLSIRVFVGRRSASASTSDLGREAVRALVRRAIAMAAASPEDPFSELTPASELARKPEMDLQTCDTASLTPAELLEMAEAAEAAAISVKGVVATRGAGASFSESRYRLATSNGFVGEQAGSLFSVGCGAIAGSGGSRVSDGDSSNSVYLGDLGAPALVGKTAGERAVARVGGRRMTTGRVPVVFDARVSNSLLGHLAGALSGAAVVKGSSFLQMKLGCRVFPESIDLIDDPLRARGLRSRWFDGEGVATRRVALVQDGILTTWFLDRATAKQLNLRTNGQANRTGAGTTPGPSNFYLAAGDHTPQELLSDIKYGLYVTAVMGQGVNGLTGSYSRGATGFLIENGEITVPVKEVTIASNLLEMFGNLTPADDLEFRYGIDAPTVRIDEMTVAGSRPPVREDSKQQTT